VRQGSCRGCGREFSDSIRAELELTEAQEWYNKPRPGSAILAKVVGCFFLLTGLIAAAGVAAGGVQLVRLIRGDSVPKQDLLLLTLIVIAPVLVLESRMLFSRSPLARPLGLGLMFFLALALVGLWAYVKYDGGKPSALFGLLAVVILAVGVVLSSPPMRDFLGRDLKFRQRLQEIEKRYPDQVDQLVQKKTS